MDSGISNKMWLSLLLWIHHGVNQAASLINHRQLQKRERTGNTLTEENF